MNEAVTITPFVQWLIEYGPGLVIASIPIIILLIIFAWFLTRFPPPIIDYRFRRQ